MSGPGDDRGVALVLSLLVLTVLSGLTLALLSVSALEPTIAKNLGDAARARWLAEAGIEVGFGTLVATADGEGGWSAFLEPATPEAPWVALPGLAGRRLPGPAPAAGSYTVSIRNDSEAGDGTLTGEPVPDAAVARDANGIVIMRSTGTFNAATRTIEVVVRRRPAPDGSAAGVRALHAMSNWREL